MKDVFTAVEHGAIGQRIVKITDTVHELSALVRPNKDLGISLIEILEKLQEFCVKMRDKYSEQNDERWKQCRPFQKEQ